MTIDFLSAKCVFCLEKDPEIGNSVVVTLCFPDSSEIEILNDVIFLDDPLSFRTQLLNGDFSDLDYLIDDLLDDFLLANPEFITQTNHGCGFLEEQKKCFLIQLNV